MSQRIAARAVALILGVSGAASAEDSPASRPTWQLGWESPEDCPDVRDVRAQVESLLAASENRRNVTAHGVVWRDETGSWHARLETDVDGSSGERALEGATCEEVTRAAALVIALSIDPTAVRGTSKSAPPESKPGSNDALNSLSASEAAADVSEPERDVRRGMQRERRAAKHREPYFLGQLGVDAGLGVLPEPAYALAFGAGVGFERWRARIAGAWWPTQRAFVEPQKGGDIGLVTVEGQLSLALVEQPVAVGPYVGFLAGSMDGEGFGITSPSSGHALWAAGSLGAELDWKLSANFALTARAGLLVALYRQRFQIDNIGVVHEPGRFGAIGSLGSEIYFP